MMLDIKDIALFYFEGNIHAKVTERRNKTKYVLEFFHNLMTMIEFVHNPEIQLFTEFIKEFSSEPVLQQITEKIRVVVPGDKFAGMFDKEDAFEYNFKTIWYNKEKVDQLGLSQSECFACISHELGHFLDPSDRWATPQQTREINADQLAVKLGLGKSLQSALDKLINDNPDNQELVEGMQDRIYSISNQARSL